MSDIKETLKNTGQKVADVAKDVGHKIAEGARDAADYVKEKTGIGENCGSARSSSDIRERMDVIASCGKKVGVVDHVEGSTIKLTRNDSPDGQHHYIPTNWIDHVDAHVHLKKNSVETERGWKSDAAACEPVGFAG